MGGRAASSPRFSRESGCYPLQGRGHANLYQLFAERMLQLAAPGGRVGMLMPSGLLTDHGCADLRRAPVRRCTVDAIDRLRQPRRPVPDSSRRPLLARHRVHIGGRRRDLQTRAGHARRPAVLDDVPDEGAVPGAVRVPLTLVRRFSGDGLAVPELPHDARSRDPRAHARRRAAARQRRGLARALRPRAERDRRSRALRQRGPAGPRGQAARRRSRVRRRAARRSSSIRRVARRLLGRSRARSIVRVSAIARSPPSTNRMTLIAAIIPAGTGDDAHDLLHARAARSRTLHWFLCGVFNSFVANYLVQAARRHARARRGDPPAAGAALPRDGRRRSARSPRLSRAAARSGRSRTRARSCRRA